MINEYIPYPVKILDIRSESHDTKTYKVAFADAADAERFAYKQG